MDIGGSFNRALERFKPNAVPLMLGLVVVAVVGIVVNAVVVGAFAAILGGSTIGGMVVALVSAVTAMALTGPLWGGFLLMAGKTVMGAKPELEDLLMPLKGGRLQEFVIAGAVVQSPQLLNVVPWIGGLFAFLGGLVTNFLFFFAVLIVAEGADAKSALMRSKELVLANVTTVVILAFVILGLTFAGLLALGVGALVTVPIATLMYAETYLQLKNAQPPSGSVGGAYGGHPPPGGGHPQG